MSYRGRIYRYSNSEIVTPLALVYNREGKVTAIRCFNHFLNQSYWDSVEECAALYYKRADKTSKPYELAVVDLPFSTLDNFANFEKTQDGYILHHCNTLGKVYTDGEVIQDCLSLGIICKNNQLCLNMSDRSDIPETLYLMLSAGSSEGYVMPQRQMHTLVKKGYAFGNADPWVLSNGGIRLTDACYTIPFSAIEANSQLCAGMLAAKFELQGNQVVIPQDVFNAPLAIIEDCSYGDVNCTISNNAQLKQLVWKGIYRREFSLHIEKCPSLKAIVPPFAIGGGSAIWIEGMKDFQVNMGVLPALNHYSSELVQTIGLKNCNNVVINCADSKTRQQVHIKGNVHIKKIIGSVTLILDSEGTNIVVDDFDAGSILTLRDITYYYGTPRIAGHISGHGNVILEGKQLILDSITTTGIVQISYASHGAKRLLGTNISAQAIEVSCADGLPVSLYLEKINLDNFCNLLDKNIAVTFEVIRVIDCTGTLDQLLKLTPNVRDLSISASDNGEVTLKGELSTKECDTLPIKVSQCNLDILDRFIHPTFRDKVTALDIYQCTGTLDRILSFLPSLTHLDIVGLTTKQVIHQANICTLKLEDVEVDIKELAQGNQVYLNAGAVVSIDAHIFSMYLRVKTQEDIEAWTDAIDKAAQKGVNKPNHITVGLADKCDPSTIIDLYTPVERIKALCDKANITYASERSDSFIVALALPDLPRSDYYIKPQAALLYIPRVDLFPMYHVDARYIECYRAGERTCKIFGGTPTIIKECEELVKRYIRYRLDSCSTVTERLDEKRVLETFMKHFIVFKLDKELPCSQFIAYAKKNS